MAEFTKEQLIEQAQKNVAILRGAVERIPGASDAAVIHLRLAEIALAVLTAKPFMYGIADPDGDAHFDEHCVGSSPSIIEDEVAILNEQSAASDGPRGVISDEYRVVALYQLLEMN